MQDVGGKECLQDSCLVFVHDLQCGYYKYLFNINYLVIKNVNGDIIMSIVIAVTNDVLHVWNYLSARQATS